MISEKDYLAAQAIVDQYKLEEAQRNKILAIHISNDLRVYLRQHGIMGVPRDNEEFDVEPSGNGFRVTFPGDWNEEFDGTEPLLKELERLSNEYGRTIKLPYYYFWK